MVHDSMYIHLPDERIPEILQAMLNDPNCGTIYRIKGALPLKQEPLAQHQSDPEKGGVADRFQRAERLDCHRRPAEPSSVRRTPESI